MVLTVIEVSNDIENTSAIASWSGFVYQGKVALYQAIKMLCENQTIVNFYLKLEHLDDFVIFDAEGKAISVHQVKATQSTYRSKYIKALSDAAKIHSKHCNDETKRYFHVSVKIDDFSSYTEGLNTVLFYKYHDGTSHISPDEIDSYIEFNIKKYLKICGSHDSKELINYKFNKLDSLINSKVNFIHAINQRREKSQYKAADTNPILFSEIKGCLDSVVTNAEDKTYILELFRTNFLLVIDDFIENGSADDEIVVEIARCKTIIASLEYLLLEKLFFSMDPKQTKVFANYSQNDVDRYINIICCLPSFISNNNIPHYNSIQQEKYLPSPLELSGITRKRVFKKIVSNIDAIRDNCSLLNVLYEFDNFIVSMREDELDLKNMFRDNGKFTHNSNISDTISLERQESIENKVVKAKRIKFVSVDKACGDLSD